MFNRNQTGSALFHDKKCRLCPSRILRVLFHAHNPTPTIPILTISVFPLLFDSYGFAPFSRFACFAPFFRIPGAFPGALATILSGAKPTGHLGERSCLSGLTGSATSAPSLA